MGQIQFLTDEEGKRTAAVVRIDEWEKLHGELESYRETDYLLSSEPMRKRLLEAIAREGGMTPEEVREKLDI
jgi:antitoxin YefM